MRAGAVGAGIVWRTGYMGVACFSFAGASRTIEPMKSPIDIERRRGAWSSYWAAGALHSCIGSLVEDQDGGIGRFWRACFAGLGDGDRVLDLGTGNGALPKLLLESTACSIR